MVMTMSAFSTASLALPTICTPSLAAASREAGTRSKPSTRSPDLTQIGGHRAAHVSETDKSNVRHRSPHSLGNCSSSAPTDLKWRSTISGVTSSSRAGLPCRIAILVDDRGADAFDEIMSGDARQRDAVILLEALLDALEC